MLEDVKFCVGMSNSTSFSTDMFKYALFGLETGVTGSGVADLTGFTASMLTTPHMDDYLEELALDWQQYTTMRPSYKIGLIALQTAVRVNSVNMTKKVITEIGRAQVSEKAKKLGADL